MARVKRSHGLRSNDHRAEQPGVVHVTVGVERTLPDRGDESNHRSPSYAVLPAGCTTRTVIDEDGSPRRCSKWGEESAEGVFRTEESEKEWICHDG